MIFLLFLFPIVIISIVIYLLIAEHKRNKELKEKQKQQPDFINNKGRNINFVWVLFFIMSIRMLTADDNYGFSKNDGFTSSGFTDFLNLSIIFIYFGGLYFIYQVIKYLKGVRIVRRKNIDNLK